MGLPYLMIANTPNGDPNALNLHNFGKPHKDAERLTTMSLLTDCRQLFNLKLSSLQRKTIHSFAQRANDLQHSFVNTRADCRMTMEVASEIQVGNRIQYSGSRGTIQYVGQLEGRGAEKWVGVEWDDNLRGKHSGTYKGCAYFACAPGAGSFLKLSKLGTGGRNSLLESIRQRYIEDALDATFRDSLVVVGGGLISIEENVEKRHREFALAELRVVDASGMGVARVMDKRLAQMLPEVQELRIARSLFSGLGCVLEALEAFPRLRVLDASRNVLEEKCDSNLDSTGGDGGKRAEELEELVLNHCVLSWETVGRVCGLCVNLQTLRLHNCKLGSIGHELRLADKLKMLRTLDLDGNELKWDDVTRYIGKLENLTEVYLSGNKLCDTELATKECLTKVETLSLAHNALAGWKVITWLHNLPKLRNLRIRGNPVTSEEDDERGTRLTWRMRVIGRISNIAVLDGSSISTDERIHCEKRYLSEEISSGWMLNAAATRLEHPRGEELCRMYGLGTKTGENEGMRGDMLRVRLLAGENVVARRQCIVREMPQGAEMGRVRAVGRRLLGIRGGCGVGVMKGNHIEWERDLSNTLANWSSWSRRGNLISTGGEEDFAASLELCVIIGDST